MKMSIMRTTLADLSLHKPFKEESRKWKMVSVMGALTSSVAALTGSSWHQGRHGVGHMWGTWGVSAQGGGQKEKLFHFYLTLEN